MAVSALVLRLRRWCKPFLAALLAASALHATAQADPPERIARFDLIEGSAQHQTGIDHQTRPADTHWPLIAGDRVWTDTGSRAEIDSGGMRLRLDGASVMEFTALDPQTTQLKLTQGTLGVQLRAAEPGQRYEIDTPNLAFVLTRPGRYRIDVDPGQGLTRIAAVEPGAAGVVYGEKGESLPLPGPQRRDFVGRDLGSPGLLATVVAGDDFDRWFEQRARLDAASVSARYVSREMPGYRMLDGQGDWQNDGTYGTVWYPNGVAADWAPYRYGRWEWVQPWGWTWMDDAPWGFAPFHYGRWTQISSRWAWVPGPAHIRPTYAPALVGFVGSRIETGTLVLGNGRPGVAWFPLAPGEAWRPGYRASPRYLGDINRGWDLHGTAEAAAGSYRFLNRPGAVSGIGAEDFGRRWGDRRRMEAVTAEELARARAVQPPIFRAGAGYGGPGQAGMPPQVPRGVYGTTGVGGQPFTAGPPGGALADQARQHQLAQEQRQRELQQYRDIQQVEQMRNAQERFQPGFSQRRAEDQRRAQQVYQEQVRIQQLDHERRDQFRMEQNQREQAVQRMEQQQQQQRFQMQQQQERQGQMQQQIRQHQDQQRQQMQQQRESMQQQMQPSRGMGGAPHHRFEVRPGG
ncbi:DUF6600 domain-containing protein [Xylophilus ampelinus]|uniref:FecR family protein n=1 Tax=Xylophilus ampelinus TaxID=54067 RepID=A0A318SKF2_9BURK|nr:DUF6600 domain-containing protein [Xylophilus ampelinus]MCS4508844.1 chromosome partitioning protein ParA [Xylophilus ampelinus]PYE79415.1 hypothetical protein DFQ15_102148 [Xylophilus ampelinus]